jgi:hypothetical protein
MTSKMIMLTNIKGGGVKDYPILKYCVLYAC